MKYHVIFNPKSGAALSLSLTGDDLVRYFGDAGCHAAVDATDDDLTRKIERALASDAEVIVSAGGDGTATAIARSIVGSKKSLALVPLGTANLLARDLGVPLDIKAAIGSMGEMAITEIDAGEVNGQLFLHKVVVGVIPAMAAAREKARGGNLFAVLRFGGYLLRRLRDARKTAIAIVSRDTENRVERIHAIAVANNAYDQGWGKVFCRSSLVDGMLTLYVLRRLSVGAALRLALEMLTGRWQEDQSVSIETVRSVALHAKRNKIAAMIDGEVEMLDTPLNFRIRPKALRVLAPVAQAPKASLEK
jgi:diacylglycerol kinase family enzyme